MANQRLTLEVVQSMGAGQMELKNHYQQRLISYPGQIFWLIPECSQMR